MNYECVTPKTFIKHNSLSSLEEAKRAKRN